MVDKKMTKEAVMNWVTNKPVLLADDNGNHAYHCRTCYTDFSTEAEARECCAAYDELFWDELRVIW